MVKTKLSLDTRSHHKKKWLLTLDGMKKHNKTLFLSGFYIFTQIAFAGGMRERAALIGPKWQPPKRTRKLLPLAKTYHKWLIKAN